MKIKPWNEDYILGIDLIDKQHQELVHLAIQLEKKDSPISFKETLDKLVLYVERHFTTEQEILRLYHYPQYEDHVKIHNNFASKVYQIQKDIENNEIIVMDILVTFIENWITHHILVEDKKFSNWMKDNHIKV